MNDFRCGAKECGRCRIAFGLEYDDVEPGRAFPFDVPLGLATHTVLAEDYEAVVDAVVQSEWAPAYPDLLEKPDSLEQLFSYATQPQEGPLNCGIVFGDPQPQSLNPKTLMGQRKVPVVGVVPPASILHEAAAMRYGAFEAPRVDGTKGYGPYNWRDQPVEMMTYLDAAIRHILAVVDGEDIDPQTGEHHCAHAKAGLGIFLDALENGTLIDNRPKVRKGAASRMINERTRKI